LSQNNYFGKYAQVTHLHSFTCILISKLMKLGQFSC